VSAAKGIQAAANKAVSAAKGIQAAANKAVSAAKKFRLRPTKQCRQLRNPGCGQQSSVGS
jgi:hypothetical protein